MLEEPTITVRTRVDEDEWMNVDKQKDQRYNKIDDGDSFVTIEQKADKPPRMRTQQITSKVLSSLVDSRVSSKEIRYVRPATIVSIPLYCYASFRKSRKNV
jgi:hypothetical protein